MVGVGSRGKKSLEVETPGQRLIREIVVHPALQVFWRVLAGSRQEEDGVTGVVPSRQERYAMKSGRKAQAAREGSQVPLKGFQILFSVGWETNVGF